MEVAKELGFRNDKNYKTTQVNKEEYSITNYLKKQKIPMLTVFIMLKFNKNNDKN